MRASSFIQFETISARADVSLGQYQFNGIFKYTLHAFALTIKVALCSVLTRICFSTS